MAMLKNAWYMAGWSEEFGDTRVVERTVANRSLVLFRGPDGRVAALGNRCPHRFAPLHIGELTPSGHLRCRYHGLEFGPDGRCTHNPHGDGRIPAAARVDCHPVAERHGIVWLWMGEAARADESMLPDFSAIDSTRCFCARRSMLVKAHYQLETDNIMDLSHIQFLHPGTLGSSAVHEGVTKLEQEGHTVWSRRFISGERISPFLEQTFQVPPGSPVDRWLDVRWNAPSSMLLTVTIGISGRPREEARSVQIPHIFTPATDATTHYWFASCFDRELYPDGQSRAEQHVAGLTHPFANEDLPMLEAQQSVIGSADFWSLKPILLATDAAAVRARRVHDELLKREAAMDRPQQ
jgi:vanillate O-demethylase monooxygenase subunit